jgi:hypothetical protein
MIAASADVLSGMVLGLAIVLVGFLIGCVFMWFRCDAGGNPPRRDSADRPGPDPLDRELRELLRKEPPLNDRP